MSDSDLLKLYSKQILALAADIPHLGELETPDATAKSRSPLCGSTVTVSLCSENGKITQFAQNVKACALGQASAALLGKVVIGLDHDTILRGRDALKDMLTQNTPPPSAPFEGYEVLLPARDFKNRHASILLPFTATLAALDKLENG